MSRKKIGTSAHGMKTRGVHTGKIGVSLGSQNVEGNRSAETKTFHTLKTPFGFAKKIAAGRAIKGTR